jgi:hypothetical protein
MLRRTGSILLAALAFAPALVVSSAVTTMLSPPASVGAAPGVQTFGFQAIKPERVLDTRTTGNVFNPGEIQQALAAVPGASGIAALALSITVTQPTNPSFVTVWPTGAAMPATSTMNFGPGETVTNAAIIGVGDGNTISLYNLAGDVHVIVDITGWFPSGSGFTGIAPDRLLDTRQTGASIGENQVITLPVTGRSVPAGAIAVALNVAATNTTANSYLTVWPAGGPVPDTASVNFFAGTTVGNGVIASVGAGGAVHILNRFGSADVIVDVTGYVLADQGYIAVQPRRLIDTRAPSEYTGGDAGPLPRRGPIPVSAIDDHHIASQLQSPFGPGAVVLSVAVTQPSASGFATLWPADTELPATSNLTFRQGQTVATLVIVGTDDRGRFGLMLDSGFPLSGHVIVDLVGYFPNDGLGLVALNVNGRTNALGPDRVGVLICQDPAFPVNATQIQQTFARVSAYYSAMSGGVYVPQFDPPVYTPLSNPEPLFECDDAAATLDWPSGVELVMAIDGYARNTSGLMGFAGLRIGVPPWLSYPDNGRSGVIALAGAQEVGGQPTITGVLAHEIGHTIDFPHSGFNPYSNPMDVMSSRPASSINWLNPQGTIALNRFRAGWLTPAQVSVHRTAGSTYRIGALGEPGTQMVVIPSSIPGRYTVLGTRVKVGIDATLPKEGVEIYEVDARCLELFCTGLDNDIVPAIGADFRTDHVLAGGSLVLGGVSITVVGRVGNAFDVRIDGAPTYDFPLIASPAVVLDDTIESDDPTIKRLPVGTR